MKNKLLWTAALLSVSAFAVLLAISSKHRPDRMAVAQMEIEAAIEREYDMSEEESLPEREGPRRQFHIRPDGKPAGDGSEERPWDLTSVLAFPESIQPGDILWLHQGDYKGEFISELGGAKGAPIVVRAYPGERARLVGCDGAAVLNIRGFYTWFWGVEITNCESERYLDEEGQASKLASGVQIFGHDTRLINSRIHDTSQGVSTWSAAKRVEIYGNIITFNGYDLPDRGHGHGIYAQNEFGTLRINDNIIAHQFGHGIHAYAESGFLNSIALQGNIIFSNGSASKSSDGRTRNILLGGQVLADSPTLIQNYTFYPMDGGDGENNLGYAAGCVHPRIYYNYFAGPTSLRMNKCEQVEMKDNTLLGDVQDFYVTDYASNTIEREQPTRGVSFVRANTWEARRGHVAVYNWGLKPEFTVNIAGLGFADSETVLVRNVHDYDNDVQRLVVNGSELTISMQRPEAAAVPGGRQAVQTFPLFGAFIIEALYEE